MPFIKKFSPGYSTRIYSQNYFWGLSRRDYPRISLESSLGKYSEFLQGFLHSSFHRISPRILIAILPRTPLGIFLRVPPNELYSGFLKGLLHGELQRLLKVSLRTPIGIFSWTSFGSFLQDYCGIPTGISVGILQGFLSGLIYAFLLGYFSKLLIGFPLYLLGFHMNFQKIDPEITPNISPGIPLRISTPVSVHFRDVPAYGRKSLNKKTKKAAVSSRHFSKGLFQGFSRNYFHDFPSFPHRVSPGVSPGISSRVFKGFY